ncbi:hypothetical protein D922_01556 [Enterococcus faecalis 06-MB-DW-09]|nr:hypothetical protein D922_01556 [Enterococcus faecalis 06-MB-DW-09]
MNKKIVFWMIFSSFILVGCGSKSEADENINSSDNQTTVESSEKEETKFTVFSPRYSLDDSTFYISGKTDPDAEVEVFSDGEHIKTITASVMGTFEFQGRITDDDNISYRFESIGQNDAALVKSHRTLKKENEQAEEQKKIDAEAREQQKVEEEEEEKAKKDAELKAKREAEREERLKKEREQANSSSSSPTNENTESSKAPEHKKVASVSDDQQMSLVVHTQLIGEDYGYNIPYAGKDNWNVVINYIDGKNRWIVTSNAPQIGRIKSIFEWTGEKDDGVTLKYLLIGGQEYFNTLRD